MNSTPTTTTDAVIAPADEQPARVSEQLARIRRDTAGPSAGSRLQSRHERRGRGVAVGLPLAACIGAAALVLPSTHGQQATRLAEAAAQEAAPAAGEAVPDQVQLLQTIARGLAKVQRDIAELKASQDEMKRELARVSEQTLPKTPAAPTQSAPSLRKPERTPSHGRARSKGPGDDWYYSDWW